MPESPEIHGLATFLRDRLVDKAIASGTLLDFAALKTFDPPLGALQGMVVSDVTRHGKFVDIDAQGVHLVFHLARAGWLTWHDVVPATTPRPGRSPNALRITMDDDSGFTLTEAGTTKRLAIHVVEDPLDVPGIAALGPDPLSNGFTVDDLAAIIRTAGRARVKGLLRDQRVLAGIGNAWSDEILHAARLSPYAPASSLDHDTVAGLHFHIREVLGAAVAAAEGRAPSELKDSKRSAMRVHGRTGEPCPACGTRVAEVSFADSSLQYCPTCQTGGTPLADRRMSRLLR